MTISKKYEGKYCEMCGTGINITRDHVVPKWLEKRLAYFELDFFIVNNHQYLCQTHNTQKGGKVDYYDIRVRAFIRKFISVMEEKLKIVEKEIRVEKFKKTMEGKKQHPVNLFEESEIIDDKEKGRNRYKNKKKEKEELSGIKF